MKKRNLVFLFLALCVLLKGVKLPTLAKEKNQIQWNKADCAEAASDFLQKYEKDYVSTIVINTQDETVLADGEVLPAEEFLGAEVCQDGGLGSVLDAERCLSDSPFEIVDENDETLTVVSPYQSCRIIIQADILEQTYGAIDVLEYTQFGEYYLQYQTEADTKAAFEQLSQQYGDCCILDEIFWASDALDAADTPEETSYPVTLEDGSLLYSWGNYCIGADLLKQSAFYQDAGEITVAVLDTGIDGKNAFFKGRISDKSWDIPSDYRGSERLIDEAFGETGHGTHIAGIVADATPDNVKLMSIRVYDSNGAASTARWKTAIAYAVEQGADIINISSEIEASGKTVIEPQLLYAQNKNVSVICSAGNHNRDASGSYPASSPLTIAVSAVDSKLNLASFSNYGAVIDFCAPGVAIKSAKNNASDGETVEMSGTSMAAPHISAAMAYIVLSHPNADAQQRYNLLKAQCRDLGAEGKDSSFGWGLPQMMVQNHVHQWSAVPLPSSDEDSYSYACEQCTELISCPKKCGNGVQWKLENGCLTISGEGSMDDFSKQSPPWSELRQSIREVRLSDGITVIGEFAFQNCSRLEVLSISASVRKLGTGAFSGCTALKEINTAKENEAFQVEEGCILLSADGTELLLVAAGYGIEEYCVPETVTAIKPYAFYGCHTLKKVVCSKSVQTIGENVFGNCDKLEKLYFLCQYPSINSSAFVGVQGCTAMYSSTAKNWPQTTSISSFGGVLTWQRYYADITKYTATYSSSAVYTGEAVEVSIVLEKNGYTLEEAVDYTVAYSGNTEAGQATATICGKGAFYGTKPLFFDIVRDISSSKLTVSVIEVQQWDGTEKKPALDVYDGERRLTEGSDYTLSYQDNIGLGEATVTILGKGYYCGKQAVSFSIIKALNQITSPALKPEAYTGSKRTPTVVLYDGSEQLTEGKDYYVTYRENINAGIAYADLTGTGYYTGSVTIPFTIEPCSIFDAEALVDDMVFTGQALYPAVTVKMNGRSLVKDKDYILSYADNTEVGNASVTITGIGNYAGVQTVAFRIRKPVSMLSISALPNAVYTGNQLSQKPNVYDGTRKLTEGKDYTLAFGKNVNVGTGTVTVTGKESYTGSCQVQFKIQPYSISKASVSVANVTYNGKSQTPAVTVSLGKKVLVKDKDYILSYSGNKAIGTATVKVTGKGNYSGTAQKNFVIAPPTTELSTVSSKTKGTLLIKWKKNSSVSGYTIQVAVNSNFTKSLKTVNVSKNSTVSCTVSPLKKKQSYYIRIRSFCKVGKKTYVSSWKVYKKNVKTK